MVVINPLWPLSHLAKHSLLDDSIVLVELREEEAESSRFSPRTSFPHIDRIQPAYVGSCGCDDCQYITWELFHRRRCWDSLNRAHGIVFRVHH
jgi:hypothetical protein